MGKRIAFVSLGCDKNRIDLEIMLAKLKENGFEFCDDIKLADAVVINTCAFIDQAKSEAIDEILSAAEYKKHGKLKAIVVTGCLAQRYKDEIKKEMPEVDCVLGLGNNKDIVKILKDVLNDKTNLQDESKLNLPLDGDRVLTTPFYSAYLKIAEGCSNGCTYCAIPLIRGKYRSRKKENIISEAKQLALNGVKELNIIAQDPTFYGIDLYGTLELANLLKELCKIDKIKWIRLFYCYPDRINDELLEVINSQEKIVKYLDMPLQHCSKNVLSAMKRYGDKQILTDLIKHIRKKVPGITLRTTLLVGFPGETDEDFAKLCDFVKEIKFDKLGCFAYSKEEGTKASQFLNQVDEETKYKRQEVIYQIQYEIMQKILHKSVGKTYEVLCAGFDENSNMYYGRRSIDAPEVDNLVYFSSSEKISPGSFIKVKINDTMDLDLIGEGVP